MIVSALIWYAIVALMRLPTAVPILCHCGKRYAWERNVFAGIYWSGNRFIMKQRDIACRTHAQRFGTCTTASARIWRKSVLSWGIGLILVFLLVLLVLQMYKFKRLRQIRHRKPVSQYSYGAFYSQSCWECVFSSTYLLGLTPMYFLNPKIFRASERSDFVRRLYSAVYSPCFGNCSMFVTFCLNNQILHTSLLPSSSTRLNAGCQAFPIKVRSPCIISLCIS